MAELFEFRRPVCCGGSERLRLCVRGLRQARHRGVSAVAKDIFKVAGNGAAEARDGAEVLSPPCRFGEDGIGELCG